MRAGRAGVFGIIAIATLLASACGGGTAPPPQPGTSRGFPPDLRGLRVMLMPVQQNLGVRGDPDAELAFQLTDRGREVEWIVEDEMLEVLSRSPGMNARTRNLPVGVFLQAEVDRVGDPLYGDLRRIAALVDADAVFLPVSASYEPNPDIPGSGPRVRFAATVVEPRTGRVVWFGIEEGGEFAADDPRGLATAVERLARTLLWYVGG